MRAAIAEGGGRITFARFMEICLYHPARGYYASFGPPALDGGRAPASDYFTSVDLHPAFGRLLAREAAVHLDRALAEGHGTAWIVEPGAGRGLLARDILQALALEQKDLFARVRYVILEPNPGWEAIQRRNLLPDFEGKVEWVRTAGTQLPLRNVRGVVLSNELFDALPFHRLRAGEPVVELFVEEGPDGRFRDVPGAPSREGFARDLDQEGVELVDGQGFELCPSARSLAAEMARAVSKGAAIVVDYGDSAGALYDAKKRPEGTMRCFFRHRLNDEPLSRIGLQDITASVDFTALAWGFKQGGMQVRRIERQGEFLARHGLDSVRAKLERDAPGLAREVYVRHRRALEALAEPNGLGGNLVLVAWR